jgi:hypothetical protein
MLESEVYFHGGFHANKAGVPNPSRRINRLNIKSSYFLDRRQYLLLY